MASAKLVLTLMFTLTLGAGLVTGMLVTRAPLASAATRPIARTPLSAELGLTPDQAARMHDIWEGVRDQVDDCFHRAQQAQQRRDAALLALLTPDQKAAFAKSQQEYTDTVNALRTERDTAFQQAVSRTEQILTPAQRSRYRQILDARLNQESATPDWISPPATQPAPAHKE